MMRATSRLSFLGILASEGVELRLGADGRIRPSKRIEDPQIDAFVRENRDAIARELEALRA